MIEYVREGDTVVGSIDRLARNFRKEQLRFSGGSDAIQTLRLQMMGAFAQFERSMIRERQREGIAAAKAAGKIWQNSLSI